MRDPHPVKDDAMKPLLLPALAVSAVAFTGCTVHNHYYRSSQGAMQTLPDGQLAPGHALLAQQLDGVHLAMEAVAYNIANIDSLGYKSKRITFVQGQTQPQITIDWEQGSAIPTNRELDLYIEGAGFIKVDVAEELGGGEGFTRMGNLFVNRDGDLVLGNTDGARLSDNINLSQDCLGISISSTGEIDCINIDGSISNVGQISLHRFVTPDGLEPLGNGVFLETEASGPPTIGSPGGDGLGTLLQGHLESSNVSLITELVELKRLARWADAIAGELGLPALEHQPMFTFSADVLPSEEIGTILSHDR